MNIMYSAICACGKVRKENQDRIYLSQIAIDDRSFCSKKGRLQSDIITLAVFDGMGGEQCGEQAAQLALQALEANEASPLEQICNVANEAICSYMLEHQIRSMGAAAAIVRIHGNDVCCCNLGDSRIYLFNQKELHQLSVDHAMTIGPLKPRRVLTQHLGIPNSEMVLEPNIRTSKIKPKEKLLLCSDGLTDMTEDQEIRQILGASETQDAAERLFTAAMDHGGKDNISIIVCEVEQQYGEL